MKDLRASRRKAPSLSPRMLIVYRAIDQLKPDPNNAVGTAKSKSGKPPNASRSSASMSRS